MNRKKITIIGAGISGLATAYWLKKNDYDVTILEMNDDAGGAMITEHEDCFLTDFGPNSGLETTPLIRQIVEELELDDEMIYSNPEANKRYILKNEELIPLPMSPASFLGTKLFSPAAKLRLFLEPFIGRSNDGYYQSIAEFVRRRLGREFLDYAIDPFVSGVFAGDPNKLSVKSAFPKLYRLEEKYGGLIKGMFLGARERKRSAEKSKQNAKMFTFRSGMQIFPITIADWLGNSVHYNTTVNSVEKNATGYIISYTENGTDKSVDSDIVFSTAPAHITAGIFNSIDKNLSEQINSVYYPPVKVLYAGYKKSQINRPLDGFGFLIPSKEKRNFLGAIWSSVIFPNRAPEDSASFTIFIGGARTPEVFDNHSNINEIVLSDFQKIMKIEGNPVFIKEYKWDKAIPQYNLGHIETDNFIEKFELHNPGIFLGGNYKGGISVGDCVKNSEINYQKIKEFINKGE